jgi:hypothetical protein
MARAKQEVFPKPTGEMVEIYLPSNEQYKKGHVLPYSINGYQGRVIVGSRNTVPRDVVTMLKNCQSKTAVIDVDRYDERRGGVPRRQEQFENPATKLEVQSDFDIEELRVL